MAEPLPAGMDPATTTSTDELHSFVVLAAPAAPKVVIPEVANLTSSMDNVDLDVGSVKVVCISSLVSYNFIFSCMSTERDGLVD